MKYLILGGLGYIGSRVVSKLLQDPENYVMIYDRMDYETNKIFLTKIIQNGVLIKDDIRNFQKLEPCVKQSDVIINLAALVGEPLCQTKKDEARSINHMAAKIVGDLCEKHEKKLVFMSTCSNYGISEGLADELSELKPISLYAQTKVFAERYLSAFTHDTVILRCATAFGVSDSRTRFDILLNEFVKDALEKSQINVYMPNAFRPICHVDDIAEAVVIASRIKKGREIFNIGSNDLNLTKLDIANAVAEKIKCQVYESKGKDNRDYKVDFSKFQKATGFKTKFNVAQGIEEIQNAYENGMMLVGSNVIAS